MAQLQRPEFAYLNGKLVLCDEATLHVGCEASIRGLNVLEGIKGCWQPDGQFKVIMMRQHYERLNGLPAYSMKLSIGKRAVDAMLIQMKKLSSVSCDDKIDA
ncbi:MAG: hypothetical protein WBK08_00625 [Nitrospira sp.]|nr:MAG: hypothetical protein E8D42_17170 [Nitrospira sp.]